MLLTHNAKVHACMLYWNHPSPLLTALSKPVWLLMDIAAVPGMYLLVSSICLLLRSFVAVLLI